jgi:hypothetical protein
VKSTGLSLWGDGRWLAYGSNDSGKSEVRVRSFPAPASSQGGKCQVSNNGGKQPFWMPTRNTSDGTIEPNAITLIPTLCIDLSGFSNRQSSKRTQPNPLSNHIAAYV